MTNPEVTTERTPGSISKSDLTTQLLAEIQAFLDRSGMAERTFGWKAVNDKRLVEVLRGGASVTLNTAEAVRTFMAKHAVAPDTGSAIAAMLRAPTGVPETSPAPFALTEMKDCPAYAIGLRIQYWIDRQNALDEEICEGAQTVDVVSGLSLEREIERAREAIRVLEDAMSFCQATSFPGALAQMIIAASLLIGPLENVYSEPEKERRLEGGIRCIYSASRALELAGGVSGKALGGEYYLPPGYDKLWHALGGAAVTVLSKPVVQLAGALETNSFSAAKPPSTGDSGDSELLRLGEQLDRACAHWRRTVRENREPGQRLEAALYAAKDGPLSRHGEAVKAAWDLPGVTESHDAEARAFEAICPIVDEIWKLPARTVSGLAVKARAALPHLWPRGNFEENAALGDDEDLPEQVSRFLIEACCALAGVDWRGDPSSRSPSSTGCHPSGQLGHTAFQVGAMSGLGIAPTVSADAEFLALAPKLLPMLDAFDRHWSQSKMMFAKVDAIFGEIYTGSSLEGASKWAAQRGQSPEYQRYLEARQPADDLGQAIEAMVDPFMGLPALTLDGLLLKRRVAQTLTQYSGDDSICQDLDGLLASRLEKGFLGTSAEKSVDPYNAEVFHVLNEHRAAARALEATINPSDRVFVRNHGGDASDGAMAPAIAANEAANERLDQAWRDIFKVRPRSLHGLLILLRHVAQHYDAHSTMVDEPDVFGALAGAVAGLRHAGMPEAQHDLSLLSIAELEALADVCRRQSEALTAVLCQPMCEKQGVTDYNSLGNIIDGEADRIGILGNDAEDEIERRKPSNDYERNLILKARIRSHLSGNGYIEPDLLAEAVAAWGGLIRETKPRPSGQGGFRARTETEHRCRSR